MRLTDCFSNWEVSVFHGKYIIRFYHHSAEDVRSVARDLCIDAEVVEVRKL